MNFISPREMDLQQKPLESTISSCLNIKTFYKIQD